MTETGAMAYALGAQIFEKRCIKTEAYGKNAYSAGPEDLKRWLECFSAVISTGKRFEKVENAKDEVASLRDLQRLV